MLASAQRGPTARDKPPRPPAPPPPSQPPSPAPPPPPAEILVRTSWIDAALALRQLDKGRIRGGRTALWARAWLQERLAWLGSVLHSHAGKVLFVAILVLASFCVGLKSAQMHTRVEQLWIQEGGRLEAELQYSRDALGESSIATHQLVLQAARDPSISPLSPRALLAHLDAISRASQIKVTLYDLSWGLRELCYKPSVPEFVETHVNQIFELIMPCAIVTPLDCFWEGSKLLASSALPPTIPELDISPQWTHLNPRKLVDEFKKKNIQFPFSTLDAYMKRAGITTGYQEKPCLNTTDPLCPETAPNKRSQQPPDVGAELSGGCYGFATKYMHWPEELIVGGGEHNQTGHLKKARALQTVVQLMTEKEMFDYWFGHYRVHNIEWTPKKAAAVLDAWQREFSKEIDQFVKTETKYESYDFLAFSTSTLNDILGKFTTLSIPKIAVGYVCILLYVAASLVQWQDSVKSQAGVGIAGVVLLSVTVAAGLGFCALLGIPFNASTMQIIPFLALGLGVDDMFLLTHAYAKTSSEDKNNDRCEERTQAVLRTTGLSVLQASLSNVCAFFAAALIPIPALRVFSLQAAILLLFNLASMLLVYPAMISIDMHRRKAQRSDLLCCILPKGPNEQFCCKQTNNDRDGKPKKMQTVTRALPPDRSHTVTVVDKEKWSDTTKQPLDPEGNNFSNVDSMCFSLSLSKFAHDHYAPFILKPSIKVISMLTLISVLIMSLMGVAKVTDGLELTDIVPQNTNEYNFLSLQGKYFGFYSMYAITKGNFEYPTNQKLLYEYHEAFVRIPNIVKNDNGGLPEFWLSLFRDWLIELQKSFDRDFASGRITQEKWYPNASEEAIMAYKLLVQTGHVDNPTDKTLITRIKLVDSEGIINPKAFYNYLSAWASNDALAYGSSQANLKPIPKQWFSSRQDFDLKIPKSLPLSYTQLPFYLRGLTDTESIKSLISSVRDICMKFEGKGLANFPSGIPFIFWEQYLHLRPLLTLALACALGAVLIVVGILLLNIWAAILVILALAAMVLQLLGAMALLDIKLSAIPAVLIIAAVGIGVHFTVHICLSFVTSIGGRDRRIRLALEHMFAPVVHGALTTLLAVIMLITSDFNFIVRYFFSILLTLIAIGLVNGLLFFPVLLSLVGPAAEVIPLDHPDRISTPSPESSPVRVRRTVASSAPHHRIRPPSLTTITEEPPSCHSSHSHHSSMQSIVVQPEVVVETTTYNTDATSGSGRSTPTVSSVGGITTKVTATANIKVEVHTPLLNGDRCHSRRSHYRCHSRDAYHDRDKERDRDYYDRDRDSYYDRDGRERDKDRERSRDRDRDGYRDRRDREKDRDRERHRDVRDSYREGRDSGHESDTSRH